MVDTVCTKINGDEHVLWHYQNVPDRKMFTVFKLENIL